MDKKERVEGIAIVCLDSKSDAWRVALMETPKHEQAGDVTKWLTESCTKEWAGSRAKVLAEERGLRLLDPLWQGDAINGQTEEDLRHILPGEPASPQQELRMIYNATRRAQLAKDLATPREVTFNEAVNSVRSHHPGFVPQCDNEYFGWQE